MCFCFVFVGCLVFVFFFGLGWKNFNKDYDSQVVGTWMVKKNELLEGTN